ncbi:MAG TPA: hypothetical protein VMH88_09530 [Gemmatimonadales bacterium]|nr:hypothetical protein [Gemmatimonadales bacterium]
MNEAFAILATMFAVTGTLTVVFGIGWLRAHRRIRSLERQLSGAPPESAVDRLEQDIATLADQLNQLANGQEFLSRIVADRVPAPRLKQAEDRIVTPK